MSSRRIAALAVSSALVAGGTGAAIAAVSKDDRAKAEASILKDAAKRLKVTPQKLRDALAAAQDAEIDKAVKDGTLAQAEADAIKARRKQSGRVLGGGALGGPRAFDPGGQRLGAPGPHPAPQGRAFGGRFFGGGIGLDLAKALGVTREQLGERLRAGESVADIAKAQGKSLSEVRTALKSAAKARLDKAVKDGELKQEGADKLRARINDGIDRVGTSAAPGPRLRMRRHAPPFLDPTP